MIACDHSFQSWRIINWTSLGGMKAIVFFLIDAWCGYLLKTKVSGQYFVSLPFEVHVNLLDEAGLNVCRVCNLICDWIEVRSIQQLSRYFYNHCNVFIVLYTLHFYNQWIAYISLDDWIYPVCHFSFQNTSSPLFHWTIIRTNNISPTSGVYSWH